MDKEKINEIIEMFPAKKPLCFNYQNARNIVFELLQELRSDRILNILIDYQDSVMLETQVNMFRVRDDIENPERAFAAAIEEFCTSDNGADMIKNAKLVDVQRNIRNAFLHSRGFSHLGVPTNFQVPIVELEEIEQDDEESLLYYRLHKLFEA